jgi:dihydroxyacid dehydratase/phosphogluconate dehydratase
MSSAEALGMSLPYSSSNPALPRKKKSKNVLKLVKPLKFY